MKGLWNKRPVLPTKTHVWNPSLVLTSIENELADPTAISLLSLSRNCATLLALCTLARVQTLNSLSVNKYIELEKGSLGFHIDEPLKQ